MVNFKQLIGLIILSIGVIVSIYAVRESQSSEFLFLGIAMVTAGAGIALFLNKR